MAGWCEAAGATLVVTTDEEAEGRLVMAARRLAYPALERQGATLLDDVAVPIEAIPALFDGVERAADRHGVVVGPESLVNRHAPRSAADHNCELNFPVDLLGDRAVHAYRRFRADDRRAQLREGEWARRALDSSHGRGS